jgi:hypothetical protein
MADVIVQRVVMDDPVDNINWIVLEGTVEGVPEVTHRRSVPTSALASGATTIAAEKAALIDTVQTHLTNWQAAQDALAQL